MRFHNKVMLLLLILLSMFNNVIYSACINNDEEFKLILSQSIMNYKSNTFLVLSQNYNYNLDKLESLMSEIINRNGNINNILKSVKYDLSITDNFELIIDFNIYYKETKNQRDYVNKYIKKNISRILNGAKSDYAKVYAINEWIKKNVSYDYSLRKTTSYDALVSKKANCNGYAMLFNRLAKEANLESYAVLGRANNDNHVWNVVKVDGKWYYMDVTWNDSLNSNKYFLLGSNSFNKDHKPFSYLPVKISYSNYTIKNSYHISNKKSIKNLKSVNVYLCCLNNTIINKYKYIML